MNENQLAYLTRRALEPANIAELLKSDMFPASVVRILITGFSDETELLNSEHSEGVDTAIDYTTHFLRTLFDLKAGEMAMKSPSGSPWKPPVIRKEFEKSIFDERGGLIFGPGYQLPTIWIHRGHGGYDSDGEICISAGLDNTHMVPTEIVNDAIRYSEGAIYITLLPICDSAPSSAILRNNPRIWMVEGNDIGEIGKPESADRLRSFGFQLHEQTSGLLGWHPQVVLHLLDDGFSKVE